jgi:hypothetical protein
VVTDALEDESGPLDHYVEVTLERLTLAHLEDCASQLAVATSEPIRLFLAARSAHLALVTSLTAAIAGSASIGAFPKCVQEQWLRYFEDSRQGLAEHPENDTVMSFKALLRVARQGAEGWLSEPLDIDMVEEFQLIRLTKLRDRTEHPRPETHMIEPSYITDAVLVGITWAVHCLRTVWHRLEPSDCERAMSYQKAIHQACAGYAES